MKPKSLLPARELGWFLQQHWPCPPASSPSLVPWALLELGIGGEGNEMCYIPLSVEQSNLRTLTQKNCPRAHGGKPVVRKMGQRSWRRGWGTSEAHTCLAMAVLHLRWDQCFSQINPSSPPLSALCPSCVRVHPHAHSSKLWGCHCPQRALQRRGTRWAPRGAKAKVCRSQNVQQGSAGCWCWSSP